jgi:hypothetical protein
VEVSSQFLRDLLHDLCPKDVYNRLSPSHIDEAMKSRYEAASGELKQIVEDLKEHPINYNY